MKSGPRRRPQGTRVRWTSDNRVTAALLVRPLVDTIVIPPEIPSSAEATNRQAEVVRLIEREEELPLDEEGPERRALLHLVLHFGRQQAAVEADELVPARHPAMIARLPGALCLRHSSSR